MSAPMSAVTISETRNLVLPLDTVLEALVHFDRKGTGILLHGEVLQARIMSGSKLPTCRLSAVGSNPTYKVRVPALSHSASHAPSVV